MTDEFTYLGDSVSSKLFDMVLQLATDLHVQSHRLRVLEYALAAKGLIDESSVEEFVPSGDQALQLNTDREALLQRILRIAIEDGPAAHPMREHWEERLRSGE